jgi:hypothetical protein
MEHVLGHEVVDPRGPGCRGTPGREGSRDRPPSTCTPPLQVVRIFGQAVAADPGARPEDGTGDSLTLQRRHPGPDVVDVDPHRLAVEGELIDRRDLEVAEGVLGGLRHLGSGRGHRDYAGRS